MHVKIINIYVPNKTSRQTDQEKKKKRKHKLPTKGMREMTSLQIIQTLRKIRKYYEQFYYNKFDNLGDIDNLFEKYTAEQSVVLTCVLRQ